MTRPLFNDCLIAADFRRLFNEMGWDRPAAHGPLALAVDAASLTIHEVAQKCGFHAYVCEVDEWPPPATRRNIDLGREGDGPVGLGGNLVLHGVGADVVGGVVEAA